MAVRLNLGAGNCPLPDYVNLDRKTGQEAFPLTGYADESVDEVRASHILEHFSHRDTARIIAEWVRVLKPGGVLKIAVPDFGWCAEKYLSGAQENILGYVCGGQVDTNDFHFAIFDEDDLTAYMEAAGLEGIQRWQSVVQDCASLPVSLNLSGVKKGAPSVALQPATAPQEPEQKVVSLPRGAVKAVMSMPRLGFTDNAFCVFNALGPLGVDVTRSSGVFWGQGHTQLWERHLHDGTKYLLTIDYDTIFTQHEVRELIRLMETRPEIDALCAIQMRRDHPFALMTLEGDEPGKCADKLAVSELSKDAIPIRTGHFGLTAIRVESLKKAKKPWFWHHPDRQGGWSDEHGKIDEDIHFWLNWRESGLTLYMANRAVVGHLQMVITWPSKTLLPVHQYHPDWVSKGKPESAL